MTERELNETKRAGLEKHLLESANGKCWSAKNHIDAATKNGFTNFQNEINAARKAIDDAEQLWLETYKAI